MINIENMTCNARDLAELFNSTPRNIGYHVDRGLPVYKVGKAGREHVFKLPWALHWYIGWEACREWGEKIPGQLETVLLGYSVGKERFDDFTVEGWLADARELAKDMGFSESAFDHAMRNLITGGLLRWSDKRFSYPVL